MPIDKNLLKSYLDSIDVEEKLKADAWDAVYSPNLKDALDKVSLANDIKADLWDITQGQFKGTIKPPQPPTISPTTLGERITQDLPLSPPNPEIRRDVSGAAVWMKETTENGVIVPRVEKPYVPAPSPAAKMFPEDLTKPNMSPYSQGYTKEQLESMTSKPVVEATAKKIVEKGGKPMLALPGVEIVETPLPRTGAKGEAEKIKATLSDVKTKLQAEATYPILATQAPSLAVRAPKHPWYAQDFVGAQSMADLIEGGTVKLWENAKKLGYAAADKKISGLLTTPEGRRALADFAVSGLDTWMLTMPPMWGITIAAPHIQKELAPSIGGENAAILANIISASALPNAGKFIIGLTVGEELTKLVDPISKSIDPDIVQLQEKLKSLKKRDITPDVKKEQLMHGDVPTSAEILTSNEWKLLKDVGRAEQLVNFTGLIGGMWMAGKVRKSPTFQKISERFDEAHKKYMNEKSVYDLWSSGLMSDVEIETIRQDVQADMDAVRHSKEMSDITDPVIRKKYDDILDLWEEEWNHWKELKGSVENRAAATVKQGEVVRREEEFGYKKPVLDASGKIANIDIKEGEDIGVWGDRLEELRRNLMQERKYATGKIAETIDRDILQIENKLRASGKDIPVAQSQKVQVPEYIGEEFLGEMRKLAGTEPKGEKREYQPSTVPPESPLAVTKTEPTEVISEQPPDKLDIREEIRESRGILNEKETEMLEYSGHMEPTVEGGKIILLPKYGEPRTVENIKEITDKLPDDFKSSNNAEEFGKNMTGEQYEAVKARYQKRLEELSEKTEAGATAQERVDLGARAMFDREAVETFLGTERQKRTGKSGMKAAVKKSKKRMKDVGTIGGGMSTVDINKHPLGDLSTNEKLKYVTEPLIRELKYEVPRMVEAGALKIEEVAKYLEDQLREFAKTAEEFRGLPVTDRDAILKSIHTEVANFINDYVPTTSKLYKVGMEAWDEYGDNFPKFAQHVQMAAGGEPFKIMDVEGKKRLFEQIKFKDMQDNFRRTGRFATLFGTALWYALDDEDDDKFMAVLGGISIGLTPSKILMRGGMKYFNPRAIVGMFKKAGLAMDVAGIKKAVGDRVLNEVFWSSENVGSDIYASESAVLRLKDMVQDPEYGTESYKRKIALNNLIVRHYSASQQPFIQTEPGYEGTGADRGKATKLGVTHFYEKGTKTEERFAGLPEYRAVVHNIYPEGDKLNLWEGTKDDPKKFIEKVKSAGYVGVQSRGTVLYFNPADVVLVNKIKSASLLPIEFTDSKEYVQLQRTLSRVDKESAVKHLQDYENEMVKAASDIARENFSVNIEKIEDGFGVFDDNGNVYTSNNKVFKLSGSAANDNRFAEALREFYDQKAMMIIRKPSIREAGLLPGENIRSALVISKPDGVFTADEMMSIQEDIREHSGGKIKGYTINGGNLIAVHEPIFGTEFQNNAEFIETARKVADEMKKDFRLDEETEIAVENFYVKVVSKELKPSQERVQREAQRIKGQPIGEPVADVGGAVNEGVRKKFDNRIRRAAEQIEANARKEADAREVQRATDFAEPKSLRENVIISKEVQDKMFSPETDAVAQTIADEIIADMKKNNESRGIEYYDELRSKRYEAVARGHLDLAKDADGAIEFNQDIPEGRINRAYLVAAGSAKMLQGITGGRWMKEMIAEYGERNKDVIKQVEMYSRASAARQIILTNGDFPDTKKMLKLYEEGKSAIGWYARSGRELARVFGKDADMMLRFLAATSALQGIKGSLNLALKAYKLWKLGTPFNKPDASGKYPFKTITANMLTDAAAGKEFGANKVRNYYDALRGDPDAVVLDTWMMRVFGYEETGKGKFKSELKDAQYNIVSERIRNEAKRLGLTPVEFQAALWSSTKGAGKKPSLEVLLHEALRNRDKDALDAFDLAKDARRMAGLQYAIGVGIGVAQAYNAMKDDKDFDFVEAAMIGLMGGTAARIGAKAELKKIWQSFGKRIRHTIYWTPHGWEIDYKLVRGAMMNESMLAQLGSSLRGFNRESLKAPESIQEQIGFWMTGDASIDIAGIETNHPKLVAHARAARSNIDNLSQLMVSLDIPPEVTQNIIEKNIGIYMPKMHTIFYGRDFIPSRSAVESAIPKIIEQYKEMGYNLDTEQALNIIENTISNYQKVPSDVVRAAGEHGIPQGFFKHGQEIPMWFRDLIGFEKNPAIRYSKFTVDAVNAINNDAVMKWFVDAKDLDGKPKYVFDPTERVRTPEQEVRLKELRAIEKPTPDQAQELQALGISELTPFERGGLVQMEDSPRWKPLSGKWVTKELYEAMHDFYGDKRKHGSAYRIFNGLLNTWKGLVTIASPITHMINLTGDIVMGMATGALSTRNMVGLGRAFVQTAFQTDKSKVAEYAGLIGAHSMATLEMGALKGALRGEKFDLGGIGDAFFNSAQEMKHGDIVGATGDVIRGSWRTLARAYDAPDQMLKIATYESLISRGLSKEMAAEITHKTCPYYQYVPSGVRAFVKMPMINAVRFLSFPSEVLRIYKNMLTDPMIRKNAPWIPQRTALQLGTTLAAALAIPALLNIDKDEFLDAVDKVGKEYMKGRWLVPISVTDTKTGKKYEYIDLARYIPPLMIAAPIYGAMRNGSLKPIAGGVVSEQDIVTHILNNFFNAINDRPGYDIYDREIFNSYSTTGQKVGAIASEYLYTLPLYRALKNVGLAIQDKEVNIWNDKIPVGLALARAVGLGSADFYPSREQSREQIKLADAFAKLESRFKSNVNMAESRGDREELNRLATDFYDEAVKLDKRLEIIGRTVEISHPTWRQAGAFDKTEETLYQLAQYAVENPGKVLTRAKISVERSEEQAQKNAVVEEFQKVKTKEEAAAVLKKMPEVGMDARQLIHGIIKNKLRDLYSADKKELLADIVIAMAEKDVVGLQNAIVKAKSLGLTKKDIEIAMKVAGEK